MTLYFTINKIEDWNNVAQKLWHLIEETGKKIILLQGNLGVGKTELTKRFVAEQNADCQVDSPTFSLVNTYRVNNHQIHHFDLYRLESAEEIEDIGFWDYLDEKSIVLIEWPEIIAELLQDEECISVNISLSLKLCREVAISY
jgi:tRNA threonylcarbamoyladenosine biosynthesis protein TsaE